ncbi:MAG: hypothetical protein IJH12_05585 [Clostridia bacterium]|nr:hypothetical protein [Clostridia bacterium]
MKLEQIKRHAKVAEENYLVKTRAQVKEFYQLCMQAIDSVPDEMVEEFVDKVANGGFQLKTICVKPTDCKNHHAEVSFYSTVGEDPDYADYIFKEYTLEDVEVEVSINSRLILEIAMNCENVDIFFEDMLSKKQAEVIFGKSLMEYEYEDDVYNCTKCTVCADFFD